MMEFLFFLFFVAVALSLLAFDAALRKQSQDHPEQWKADGCPWGFFFFTRSVPFGPGCKARNEVWQRWMFSSPNWAVSDKRASRYLVLFRFFGAIAVVLWVTAVLKALGIF
jgi:hypothetical protein